MIKTKEIHLVIKNKYLPLQCWKPDITAKFTNGCIIRVRNKNTPGVINQYAPGEFYAVTESDIWLMRYHKNILFAVNCKTTRKNKFEIKVLDRKSVV